MGSSRTTPADAYRFARGEAISLPPYDDTGNSARSLKLKRPLDFAIVTDHAENMDMVRVCSDPLNPGANAWSCRQNELLLEGLRWLGNWLPWAKPLCGDGSAECREAASAVWHDTIGAANGHNAECDFTTFIAYEWSGTREGANLHRNVIFRNRQVPDLPISALDAPRPELLWSALDSQCREGKAGCEAITIPHNPNLSGGHMFSATMGSGEALTPAVAEQRARYERLVELFQHKGDSECYFDPTFSEDELCAFEKLPYSSFLGKYFGFLRKAPANDTRYLREALLEGLRLERELGINPFTPGFIASTDTHIGAPGAVAENDYRGHHGAQSIVGDGSRAQLPDRLEQNPGGLAVFYAEQNTREAIFAAMQRREAYGTSGPRIQLRFFGGWRYASDMCEATDFVARGYRGGVPMGAVLPPQEADGAPVFAITAAQDGGTPELPGTPLQRIQVVKGWVDENGKSREKVYDVAGSADSTAGSGVDPASCRPGGEGFKSLCAVWADPQFEPGLNAWYYARAVENPSCRWQQHICLANKLSCDNPRGLTPELAGCCDPTVPKTIQERAWSSPIWYRSQQP
jgi:hypothetical protein